MTSYAFEAYRSSPPRPVTIPRLIAGILTIGVCWLATSGITAIPVLIGGNGDIEAFFSSPVGTLSALVSFAGIWLGVWLASRFIHREPLGNVLGVSGRLSGRDFCKGFIAVLLTSLLSELLIYLANPQFVRTELAFSTWLLFLVPVIVFCFVQTSAEELLFRGYLPRSLANRFRSPWIWAVLPSLAFVALHLTRDMSATQIGLLLVAIGSLTLLLILVVYWTGNLGAAFGIHMGNNLFAFALVAHQDELSGLALFKGAPVNDPAMSGTQALLLSVFGIVCVGLTWLLLVYPKSPLRIDIQDTV